MTALACPDVPPVPPVLVQLGDDRPCRELTVTVLADLVDEAKGAALAVYGPAAQLSPLVALALAEHVATIRRTYRTLGPAPYRRPVGVRRNLYPTVPVVTLEDAARLLTDLGDRPGVPDGISALVEEALRAKLVQLRTEHNGGEPFPAFTGRLRSGRRRRTAHPANG